jgi:hypothetical protein
MVILSDHAGFSERRVAIAVRPRSSRSRSPNKCSRPQVPPEIWASSAPTRLLKRGRQAGRVAALLNFLRPQYNAVRAANYLPATIEIQISETGSSCSALSQGSSESARPSCHVYPVAQSPKPSPPPHEGGCKQFPVSTAIDEQVLPSKRTPAESVRNRVSRFPFEFASKVV